MRLNEWVQAKGDGELSRLGRVTGKCFATIFKLAHRKHLAQFATARQLAIATKGATSHLELCFSEEQLAAVEPWELKRWRDFALALERERAARASGRKRAKVAA